MSSKETLDVAIVGATGAVGQQLLELLATERLPVSTVTAVASSRSAGRSYDFRGDTVSVVDLEHFDFAGTDLAFFSAGGDVSAAWAPRIAASGALVIDNSNAFRMTPGVPLAVPQVNPHVLCDRPPSGVVANPNCSTIQLVRALAPVQHAFGLERVILSSYQAASGGGLKGVDELLSASKDIVEGRPPAPPQRFPETLAFNTVPQVGEIESDGFTLEEQKLRRESQKILELPGLRLSATCVRVPVVNGHSEAVYVECQTPATLDQLDEVLRSTSGIKLYGPDDTPPFSSPRELGDVEMVHVGRLRVDPDSASAFWMWVVADNLQVGAALNAVQIAEIAVENGILGGKRDHQDIEIRRLNVS